MYKKLTKIIFLVLTLLVIGHFLPDSETKAATYSPFDVPSAIKNLKYTGNNKGNRQAMMETGKNLVYDVYSGITSNSLKQGWRVETRNFGNGSQQYLTFTGWSAIAGHRHHYANNQDTYIRMLNSETKEIKIFKAEMTTLNASKDLEYNRLPDPNNIYNACSASSINKANTECNMYYENVGFKAYLPLNDVFPNGTRSGSWDLSLIKKVGTNVLWDYLIIPFQFNDINFGQGKLSLTSGLNANRLQMNSPVVIRRTEPRGVGSGTQYGYFSAGRQYQRATQSEAYTTVWYGVTSPHDNNAIRWAPSLYWNFGGTIANLSYSMNQKTCPNGERVYIDQACKAIVTIKHIDGKTGAFLDTETREVIVGNFYSFSAKSKGTYKDTQNRPYVPTPIVQNENGTVPNHNFTLSFYYKVSIPDPSYSDSLEGTTEGQASGLFEWRLDKGEQDAFILNEEQTSKLKFINNPEVAGKHFAIRNTNYRISAEGLNVVSNEAIERTFDDPNEWREKEISFEFDYEYTNDYRANYECVDQQGNDCFEWEFTDYTPIWGTGHTKNPKWNMEFTLKHQYGDTITVGQTDNSKVSLIVGERAALGKVDTDLSVLTNEENFTLDNLAISLLTQNWLGINETIQYHSDLQNSLFMIPTNLYYFPNDIDENLREKYGNRTSFSYTNYAIPLDVKAARENLITFQTLEDFYLTQKEGFLFSAPRSVNTIEEIESIARSEYERTFGVNYEDQVFTSSENGSRYYFNIDGNGEERAGEWYEHAFVFEMLGLSDIKIHLIKDVQFDKYLLGNAIDNVVIAEENTSVDYNMEYPHSITIEKEAQEEIRTINNNEGSLIHSFRFKSRTMEEIYNLLENIIPSLDL